MKTHQEQLEKLHEMIKEMRTAMITTFHGDQLRSRPMAVLKGDGTNVLWFFTGADTEKAREIQDNSRVNVALADESSNNWVSMSGRASVIKDSTKAKELWTPFAKGWFEGPDDPNLRLIRFEIDGAEYWDGPSSKMVYIFNLLVSAVTGKEVGMGENESLTVKTH